MYIKHLLEATVNCVKNTCSEALSNLCFNELNICECIQKYLHNCHFLIFNAYYQDNTGFVCIVSFPLFFQKLEVIQFYVHIFIKSHLDGQHFSSHCVISTPYSTPHAFTKRCWVTWDSFAPLIASNMLSRKAMVTLDGSDLLTQASGQVCPLWPEQCLRVTQHHRKTPTL
jgi:hypothetical protein